MVCLYQQPYIRDVHRPYHAAGSPRTVGLLGADGILDTVLSI